MLDGGAGFPAWHIGDGLESLPHILSCFSAVIFDGSLLVKLK